MNRHQDLYKDNGIQSSKKQRLNRERVAIRNKERNDEFLSRRNISVSPIKSVKKIKNDVEANKENAVTPQKPEQTLRIALVAGKTSPLNLTHQEKFLQRFVEWKGTKKQQEQLKKKQREKQQKPFVPAVCAVIGVARNATATGGIATKGTMEAAIATSESSGNHAENTKKLKKRQSLYAIKVSKCSGPLKFVPVRSLACPAIVDEKIRSPNEVMNSKDVLDHLAPAQIIQVLKQTPVVKTANEQRPIGNGGGDAIASTEAEIATTKADIATAKAGVVAAAKTEIAPGKVKVPPNKPKIAPVKAEAAPVKAEAAPVKAKVVPTKAKIVSAKAKVAPITAEVATTKVVAAPTKTIVVPSKTQVCPVETKSIPAQVAATSANTVNTASATKRSAASPSACIVKPIRGGGGIVPAKPTFRNPLPPPAGPSVKVRSVSTKPQERIAKPVQSGNGAAGKAKIQAANKRGEELKNNSKLSVCMKAKKPIESTTRTMKNAASKLKLNKKYLLEVPHQGLPVAETPTDLTNINPFGFFVTSTKRKSTPNNFNFVRSSETPRNDNIFKFVVDEDKSIKEVDKSIKEVDKSTKESGEISRPIQKPETPVAVREALKTVQHFRKLLVDEIERLHALCAKWELYKSDNLSQLEANPDSIDMIDVTVGQTKLLTSKKFMQFNGLIDRCEKGVTSKDLVNDGSEGTKPITPVDLEGFWSMLGLQVDNIIKRFENLESWRSNDWMDPEALQEAAATKIKTKNNPIKKSKKIIKPAAKPSIALEQMMRKMHAEMRKNKAKTASGDTDIILTPSSRKRRSKSDTPQRSSTPRRDSTPRRNSTPRRDSLIVKDKKFYSAAPTVLIRSQLTPERRNSLTKMDLNSSKDSPKQLSKLINGLTNSLKKLEKSSRNKLLKSALEGAEKRRLSNAAPVTRTLFTSPLKVEATSPSLSTPLPVNARKSILKTPGTAKGKTKNVIFNEQLSIKKFKFTTESDDEEIEEESHDKSQQRTYQLRGRKVLLRPSSEFVIPVKPI